jgi:hypothetical protein
LRLLRVAVSIVGGSTSADNPAGSCSGESVRTAGSGELVAEDNGEGGGGGFVFRGARVFRLSEGLVRGPVSSPSSGLGARTGSSPSSSRLGDLERSLNAPGTTLRFLRLSCLAWGLGFGGATVANHGLVS